MINLPSIHDAPCPQLETEEMLNDGRLAITILSAAPQNNTLGQHLRQQWDAARDAGQKHGIWRPELGSFVTMEELEQQL